MGNRRLYGDAKLITQQLDQMQLMEKAENDLAAVYKDEAGKFWLKCYAVSEAQGGGYLMLIKLPLPTTEELIGVSISSDFEDEAVAAVLRLLDEEALEKKDFRHLLVEQLQGMALESIGPAQKQRVRQIITLTSLTDPTNRREVKGKTIEQLQADAVYFDAISSRALKILDRL